jgi:hypothetical protein
MTVPLAQNLEVVYAGPGARKSETRMPVERWCSFLLAAIIFEGALRKWILPSSLHPLVYAAKDVIAILFIIKHPLKVEHVLLNRLRNATVACAALLIPSLVAGWAIYPTGALMTLVNAALWRAFAFHLAAHLNSNAIYKLTKKLAYVAIAMSILAAFQFALPPTHFLNHYAWNAMGIDFDPATVAANSGVRATGTFSYITGLGSFATFGFAWFAWQYLSGNSSRRNRLCTMSACFACIVCILASGSRAPLLYCAVCVIAVLGATRRFKTLLQLTIFGGICTAGISFLPNQTLISAYVARANGAGDSFETRAVDPLTLFISETCNNPMGDGLGQHSQLLTLSGSREIGTATMNSYEDGRARGFRGRVTSRLLAFRNSGCPV